MYLLLSTAFIISYNQNYLLMAENPLYRLQTSCQLDELSTPMFDSGDIFWNISSRHFYSARVLFVILLRTSRIQLETERVTKVLKGIHDILNIPIVLFEDTVGTSGNSATNILNTSAARFGASYSLLIVSEDIDDVFKYSETSEGHWRSDVPILIFVIKKANGNCSNESLSTVEYSNLFKHLWTRHQTAKVIVFVKSLSNSEDEGLFYDPFIEINASARGQVYKYSFTGAVDISFQNAIWNLYGYLLRVAMFPTVVTAIKVCINNTEGNSICTYKGRDGFILDELAKCMNFTPCLMTPSDNILNSLEFANGTITGPLRDIANGEVDIAMNSKDMKLSHVADIEYVTPVTHFGRMCVLVPKAPRVPIWISLFRCFSFALWATLIATYILSAILWHSLRKCPSSDQLQKYVQWSTTLSDVLNIFVPTFFTKISSFNNDSQRIFVASCMFFSIVITSVFQGSLFVKLKNPVYCKDIDTLEELEKSGLPIITVFQDMYDIFDVIEMPTTRRLSERVSVFDLKDDEIKETVHRGNSSLLLSLIDIEMLFETNPNYAHLVHLVQECPATYLQSYMVPRGSPYLKSINTLIGRMFEAGLTHKWYYDAMYEESLPQYLLFAKISLQDLRQKAFSLSDILIAFIILIFGLSLGGVMFLIECFLNI
jgi:hypothetical protein